MSRQHREPARIIRREDPPPSGNVGGSGGRNPGSRWDGVAEYLRDEPRMWFVVSEGSQMSGTSIAGRINRATIKCFEPRGDFEACTRIIGGVTTVYARYVGPGW